MNIPQKNEDSLLKKAKNGDKDAFNLMVIKYQPRIMSVLYGFLKTHSDAEDLTQQTFIKAWTNLEKFRGDSSFYTFECLKVWGMSNEYSSEKWSLTFKKGKKWR